MLMNSMRLFTGMQERRLDALVATMPENVTYASGFWAMSQWIRRGPQAYVLTPAPAGMTTWVCSPRSHSEARSR